MRDETPALSPLDHERLHQAHRLAMRSVGVCDPNPRVGCIIGASDGRLLGEGFTQEAGGAHAEVVALAAARAGGADTAGATAWVTLEPCAHHGRTPPCTQALVAAGVGRVVVAVSDPYPQVAGRGLAQLRAAGIRVEVAGGAHELATRDLNVGFFSRIERGRPWIRMKLAGSLDGRAALPNGRSQWITGEPARVDGHRWRQRSGAILTGIGTVLADDPRLDVRHVQTRLQPLCAVVDRHARLPLAAQLRAPARAVVAYVGPAAKTAALEAAGVQVQRCPAAPGPGVDLAAVVADLQARQVNEVHVEAGPTLSGAMLLGGWVDELIVYVAPVLLGPGRGLVELPPLDRLPDAPGLRFDSATPVGPDLRLTLRRCS